MTHVSPTFPPTPEEGAENIERVERRWAAFAVILIVLLVVMAVFAGLHQASMPQSRVETVDPRRLHLEGEFIESNLGSALEPDGSVTVRAIGQQYSFTPQCILVPTGTPITFRMTSADVVHGFLITGTDINLMLVPGYIASLPARFETPGERTMPCHEFCGLGHEGMWGGSGSSTRRPSCKWRPSAKRLSCVK
jgi:Heme/copper-type cytochrome/quinol oxidases, subunit 2